MAEAFDDDSYAALLEETRGVLPSYRTRERGFEYQTSAHIVRARKP